MRQSILVLLLLFSQIAKTKKFEDVRPSPDQAASLYHLSVTCIRTLSNWTSHISEMV